MASLSFSWNHDNAAGSSVTFRLYEEGILVVSDIGELSFSLTMDGKAQGSYRYHVTAFDKFTKLESDPSETLTVNFTVPSAPTGFGVSWV